jgi:hypothetical protein
MATFLEVVKKRPAGPIVGAVGGFLLGALPGAVVGTLAGTAYAVFGGIAGLKTLIPGFHGEGGEDDPFDLSQFGDDVDPGLTGDTSGMMQGAIDSGDPAALGATLGDADAMTDDADSTEDASDDGSSMADGAADGIADDGGGPDYTDDGSGGGDGSGQAAVDAVSASNADDASPEDGGSGV